MRKIFNEYGGWAVIVFVIAVLLLLFGGIKSIDDNGKVKGTGLASIVGNTYSDVIDKFKNHYDDAMAIKSGPNGEPLVSTTESQVGKYADIDGDGIVDGIIFADLLFGGSGHWADTDLDGFITNSKYKIPKLKEVKSYYIKQKTFSNNLGGNQQVLFPIGTGNKKFYIMSLNDINTNYYYWYKNAYNKMSNYSSSTSIDFGKGQQNTLTIMNVWENSLYGNQDSFDMWNNITNYVNNGWFVPSNGEWSAFMDQLKISKSTYLSKGLRGWYWCSSQSSISTAFYICTRAGYIDSDYVNINNYVRLATTF